jgi:hypothetical protein
VIAATRGPQVIYIQVDGRDVHGVVTHIEDLRQYPIEYDVFTFTQTEGEREVEGIAHIQIRESVRRDAMLFIIAITTVHCRTALSHPHTLKASACTLSRHLRAHSQVISMLTLL